ncbi:hypothetical protein GCM10009676_31060 [Prauserella halophila]|uniref:Transcriptional regulator n=1 Tax=Prauserella halophila TaxID=185641 RepID=A0ABP4GY26_9PSEU|nr:hypothetical protein [Prauserella halophila]MCP2234734.1 hypothetical protein [Prauserella halophila]
MAERNELLRAARLRIESPSSPQQPMTRQELAEAINAHLYRASGGRQVTAVDANHVGKWERGVIRWPAAYYRQALRVILDVATDAELGFTRPRRQPDNVDRKTFLKTALGTGAGAMVARHLPAAPADASDLVSTVAAPTAHYRRLESAVSCEHLAPVVEAHLTFATSVVTADARTSAGYGVLAEVAGLSAWVAADRGDNATARRRYLDAIGHAERAHHPLLGAYMTASLGHFAVESGDPWQGTRLLDRAAAQLDDTAPDAARAWLASLHAVAHAALGDHAATRAGLRTAERLTGRQRGEPHWPWVFAFDDAKAARYQAGALARLGDARAAATAYQAAAPTLAAPKPRALAQLDHARALAAVGRLGEGCRLAADAARTGHAYTSERITARVREFRGTLPARCAEARELDDTLAELYETDRP